MTISLFVVLRIVEVLWVAYTPVTRTVSGAFIRKQSRARPEVEVVSVLVEKMLISKETH
jgi:hypothetical protein